MSPVSQPNLTWRIQVEGDETTAVFETAPDSTHRALFICAHGAGGHMADPGLLALSEQLRRHAIDTVRFNFLYREKGSRRPDTLPRLEACVAAVAQHAREALQPARLLLGGRSMGGRAASMLAASGFACDGLLLLAYPLHPPGKPERLRDAHLARIEVPVLCLNGTRDSLCRRELMERTVDGLGERWTMHWLEAADHSFRVLKSSGRSEAEVLQEIGHVSSHWLSQCLESR